MTEIFAHRGSRGTHPENTLPAFEEAVRVGSDGIELDVHLTKDGQLVVIHDETVNRTTDGEGFVGEMNLVDLKKLDAGFWGGEIFRGSRIPTLEEVFQLLAKLNFTGKVNVEIKTDEIHYQGIEEKVVALVKSQLWPFQVLHSSFHFPSLEILANLDAESEKNYLLGESEKKVAKALQTEFIAGIHTAMMWVEKYQDDTTIQTFPKHIRVWTVNNEEEMALCFRLGVTAIFTDYPEKAIRLREALAVERNFG